jgi:hypothetical protein
MAESPADGPAAGAYLSVEERAERILEQARDLAGHVESWSDLSHAIFAPQTGLAAQAFPTLRERREFTLTPQYAEIYRLLGDCIHKPGAGSQARPPLSHAQGVAMRRQKAEADGREPSP